MSVAGKKQKFCFPSLVPRHPTFYPRYFEGRLFVKELDKIQRQVLPIPDRQHVGLTTYDAKDPDTKYPPIEPLRPPKGAPNVLIILLDDTGFGASSAFGGPVHMPTAERLAANGLKYNRFHTTALCSPTR